MLTSHIPKCRDGDDNHNCNPDRVTYPYDGAISRHAGTPAAAAGLEIGDHILKINDINVARSSPNEIENLIQRSSELELEVVYVESTALPYLLLFFLKKKQKEKKLGKTLLECSAHHQLSYLFVHATTFPFIYM